MTIDERIEKLEKIVAESRARRAEVEDQLERHDIPADELVDFRIQITAQLSVLDDTVRRLKRRLRDLKLIQELKNGKRRSCPWKCKESGGITAERISA